MLTKELFEELFKALKESPDLKFIDLEMGLCCFVLGPFELVCVNLDNNTLDMQEFLLSTSVDTKQLALVLDDTFGTIQSLLGVLSGVSNYLNKLESILNVARLSYQSKMKDRVDNWKPGEKSLQESLNLNDVAYKLFITGNY